MSVVRYLIVVGRSESDLRDYLTRQFTGDPFVTVVGDRRGGDRRTRRQQRAPDRRRSERRRTDPAATRVRTVVIIRREHEPDAVEEEAKDMGQPAPTETRTKLVRWLDESRDLLAQLPGLVDELVATEQECERLRQWVNDCRAENARLRAERAELAEALSALINQVTRPMNEIVHKLRLAQQGPA